MKTSKILLAIFISCAVLAGCKPAGQNKGNTESLRVSVDLEVTGIPISDITAPDDAAAIDGPDSTEGRDSTISRALIDSNAVYAKVFDSTTHVQSGTVVSLNKKADNSGYYATLTLPALGSFTILAYAVDISGYHLFSGTGSVTVTNDVANPRALSITMTGSSATNGTAAYSVGGLGPGGGTVFYVAADYTAGWRYMEAAPIAWNSGSDPIAIWMGQPANLDTTTGIGAGLNNTATMNTFANKHSETNTAAQLCVALNFNSYTDWFLPSDQELYSMRTYLSSSRSYWSSSGDGAQNAWYYNYSTGVLTSVDKSTSYYVRPARRY